MASIVLGIGGSYVAGPVGGIIGSMLGGWIDSQLFAQHRNIRGPSLTDLSVPGASYGMPIPRVYGAMRLSGQLIYSSQLSEVDVTTSQGGGGGGGKGTPMSGGNTSVTYTQSTYYATFAVALCQGPITAVLRVWANGQVIWDYRTMNLNTNPASAVSAFQSYPGVVTAYLGTETQTADSTLEAQLGAGNVPAFRGTSYLVFNNLPLANFGDSVPTIMVEVVGLIDQPYSSTNVNALCSLKYIVTDLCEASGLSSGQIDVTALPSTLVPGFAIGNQSTGRQALSALQQAYFFDGVESDYKIKFVPQTGSSIATVSESDLGARAEKVDEDVPKIKLTRVDDVNLPLRVVLRYSLSQIDYQTATTHASRPGLAVNSKQLGAFDVPISMMPADAKASAETALYLAWIGRVSATFSLPRSYLAYDPGDILTVDYNNGTSSIDLFLQQIDFGADETLQVTAVAADAPSYTAVQPANNPTGISQLQIPPSALNTPLIFEPPVLLETTPTVCVAATSAGPNWGGCNMWISFDSGGTYQYVGKINAKLRLGTTTASLAAATVTVAGDVVVDSTNTLSVDISESAGAALTSVTNATADTLATLCYCDGEVIGYTTATNTGTGKYDLTRLERGVYGTPITSHSSSVPFVRLDPGIGRITYTPNRIGQTALIKLTSFNQYGGNEELLTDVTPISYTIQGPSKPLAPSGLVVIPGTTFNTAQWATPTNQSYATVELWASVTDNLATATLVSTGHPATQSTLLHSNLLPGETWYYWIRGVDVAGQDSAYFPSSPTAGVAATVAGVTGSIIAAATITGAEIAADTIQVNNLQIGQRGLTSAGIQFTSDSPTTNSVAWSSGTINYVDNTGALQVVTVASANAAWTTGILYIYWVQGATSFSSSTVYATASAGNNVLIAAYSGGTTLEVLFGQTIIQGANIVAGSITTNNISIGAVTDTQLTDPASTSITTTGNTTLATLSITGDGYENLLKFLGTLNFSGAYYAATTISGALQLKKDGTLVQSFPLTSLSGGTGSPAYGPNIAPTALTSASGNAGGASIVSNVVDGVTSTFWRAAGAPSQWWQAQFALARTITQIGIIPNNDGTNAEVEAFTFQGSNNGSTWTTLLSATNPNTGTSLTPTVYNFVNATAYLYYRFNITSTYSSGNAGLIQLYMYEGPVITPTYGTNLAPSGSAFTASQSAGGHAASAGADGDLTTYWLSNAGPAQWWQVDFGSGNAQVIQELILSPYQNGSDVTVREFNLQGSNDGSTFTTVCYGVCPNTLATARYTFSFANLTAYRYYRINITSSYTTGATPIGIFEAQLYSINPLGGIVTAAVQGLFMWDDTPSNDGLTHVYTVVYAPTVTPTGGWVDGVGQTAAPVHFELFRAKV